MNKKMMLLALSVVSAALFALPAVASATSAHISATENFTITSTTATELEEAGGSKITCHGGVSGTGSFENTTTGTINLLFHNCTAFGLSCSSEGQPAGTIKTTALPFHLITIESGKPGVLITSNNNHFADFNCPLVGTKQVTGNGILGTITAPKCGEASTTATLSFAQGATTGQQLHRTFTGTTYQLLSNGTNAAQSGTGQIHFEKSKTITCT